jgi:hypothetical protein
MARQIKLFDTLIDSSENDVDTVMDLTRNG